MTALIADGEVLSPEDQASLKDPFLQSLVSLIRAQDRYGLWEKRSDARLLDPFVIDKEKRRQIPIIGDPSPEVLARVGWFYGAVALRVENQTGIMASPIMELSSEGFGRMVVTAGRLVVVNRHLRDLHRFGFPSLAKLAEDGGRVVGDALIWIAKFPDVANA
jgi:probable nitrogen fixation protein